MSDPKLIEILADCADALATGATPARVARRLEELLPCVASVEEGSLRLRWRGRPSEAERAFARALVALSQLARPVSQPSDGQPLDPQNFHAAAEQAVAAARWRRQQLSVAVVEVEGMELGPGVDERHLLSHVGAVAHGCVRADDLVGHLGANQFALLLPRTGSFEARVAVRRFRAALAETQLAGRALACELVGYASVEEATSATELVAAARERLASVKRRRAYQRPGGPSHPLAG